MTGLHHGLLALFTLLAGAVGALGSNEWTSAPLTVALGWVLALGLALLWSLRVLEPPREVRLGPVSPIVGGIASALLVVWHPTVLGATLAVLPLALAAHLTWSQALRRSLADVPFELWEAAWLLGATRSQAVRHVALPAATHLRPRLTRATAWAAGGALLGLLALGWTA